MRRLDDEGPTVALRVPSTPRAGEALVWELEVTNRSAAPLELAFPTSQLGDVVLERAGVPRYRWSDGRVFLQVVGQRTLAPGAGWTFELAGELDVEPGDYDAVGTVACRPRLPPARARLTVL